MLVVVPGRSWAMAAGSTTSACSRSLTGWRADHHEVGGRRGPARPAPSGKSPRGSAPSRTRRASARTGRQASHPARRAGGDPGPRSRDARIPRRRGPAPSGTEPQAASNHCAPGVEGHPAGQQARGQAHVERADHVAPPQGREEAAPGQASASRTGRPRRPPRACSASDGRPSTTTTPSPAGSGPRPPAAGGPRPGRRGSTGALGVGTEALDHAVVAGQGPRDARGVPRPEPERHRGVGRERRGPGRQLDEPGRPVDRRSPRAAGRARAAPRAGRRRAARPPEPEHASSMVARGRPRTSSAGRPSPSWASTESVPSTPLASLAQA